MTSERQIQDATFILPHCPTCGPNPGPECPWAKITTHLRERRERESEEDSNE